MILRLSGAKELKKAPHLFRSGAAIDFSFNQSSDNGHLSLVIEQVRVLEVEDEVDIRIADMKND
jgi:hypothetical protein